ncbi:MAG: hypothetical protein ABFR53_12780, partial [Actinomycetota bacterium]
QILDGFDLEAADGYAVGRVMMEGRVVEHEHGYRAERARVVSLVTVETDDVRLISELRDLAVVFESPEERHELGVNLSLGSGDDLRAAICKYLLEEETGEGPWT